MDSTYKLLWMLILLASNTFTIFSLGNLLSWLPQQPPSPCLQNHQETSSSPPYNPILNAYSLIAWNGTVSEYQRAINLTSSEEIPRLIHFTYFSSGLPLDQPPPPENVQANIEGWKTIMEVEGYIVVLWDNQAIRQAFAELSLTLEKIPTMSWVSNVARYHILERYGGLYLDTDIVPLRSPDILLQNLDMFGTVWTVCEKPNNLQQRTSTEDYAMTNCTKKSGCQKCKRVNNAVIAGPPQHPVFINIKNRAMNNTMHQLETNPTAKYRFEWTGPPLWTEVVNDHIDVSILHATLFYPCNWDRKALCQEEYYTNSSHVYGMHQWSVSWKDDMYKGPKLIAAAKDSGIASTHTSG